MTRHPSPPMPAWLEELVPFERYLVDVGDAQMHVMESGEGRPVVLLHGNPTWGFLYRKVAVELTGEPLRVIMPDLIGFGFSSRPAKTSDHTIANHAAWFGRLLDALDLTDLIFMGQDWGGAIGTLALADRPGRLGGLVLANTVVTPPKAGFKPTAFHRLARLPVASDLLFRGFGYPQRNLNLGQGEPDSIRGNVARHPGLSAGGSHYLAEQHSGSCFAIRARDGQNWGLADSVGNLNFRQNGETPESSKLQNRRVARNPRRRNDDLRAIQRFIGTGSGTQLNTECPGLGKSAFESGTTL